MMLLAISEVSYMSSSQKETVSYEFSVPCTGTIVQLLGTTRCKNAIMNHFCFSDAGSQ